MAKEQITVPIFIPHRGCPHCCKFCNQWRVSAAPGMPDEKSIGNTLEVYLKNLPTSVKRVEVAFFGGSFTAIEKDLQEYYLSLIGQSPYRSRIDGIRLSTRPDYINGEILALLKYYGVETVELGVQSLVDEVLELSGRGHSVEDVENAMELLKSEGFRRGIQLMPGLPGDNEESIIFSAQKTLSLAPDDVRIYPTVVLKDTELERMYSRGEFTPLSLEMAVELSARIYDMFLPAGINIIRMGIHPMEMASESVVAGPYHTSLGFLVKSRSRLNKLLTSIESLGETHGVRGLEILLPSICPEEYIGLKRGNIEFLQSYFKMDYIKYSISDVSKPEFTFFY